MGGEQAVAGAQDLLTAVGSQGAGRDPRPTPLRLQSSQTEGQVGRRHSRGGHQAAGGLSRVAIWELGI